MEAKQLPKWQKEVLQILRDQYQGDELEEQIAQVNKLVEITESVEIPSGVVAQMLKMASDELRPLTAVYVAFRLGVAVERNQNADRA